MSDRGCEYKFAKRLVFKKLRERLGLGSARLCCTGAAPTTKQTLDFFLSLDIPLFEVFGMSECSGLPLFSMKGFIY